MIIALLSLAIWVYLVAAHGRFWSSGPEMAPGRPAAGPAVDIIVPARDEAGTIVPVIESLLLQDYLGAFRVLLVDDNSSDETAALAGHAPRLRVLRLNDKPPGWSGKLWALSRGVSATAAPLILFSDADIVHRPNHLSALVTKLENDHLVMASEMVRLHCTSVAEKALIPAFVYFFQMLYPFARVNRAASTVAAAAGGTVLIRRETLLRLGGIEAIRHTLIDDVALAKAAKVHGPIYLGHSGLADSIRPYPSFADIWNMVARTAFTQLRFSAVMLIGTVAGLTLVWLAPPALAVFAHGTTAAVAATTCVLAAASFLPTLHRYRRNPLWALCLPAVAMFYMAATMGSAIRYWQGHGATWKQRSYDRPS